MKRGSCRAGCGECCDPVILEFSREQIAADHNAHPLERAWARDALVPMTRREAMQIRPDQFNVPLVSGDGTPMVTPMTYRCTWFDRDTRECTNYANRPPVCLGYPWYDYGPHEGAAIPTCCGYRVDIGKTVEPLPVRVEIRRKP